MLNVGIAAGGFSGFLAGLVAWLFQADLLTAIAIWAFVSTAAFVATVAFICFRGEDRLRERSEAQDDEHSISSEERAAMDARFPSAGPDAQEAALFRKLRAYEERNRIDNAA